MKFIDFTEEKKKQYVSEAKELCEFLKSLKLNPHLGFGTLLGAVRGGKLIDGDYDIDICYLSKYNDRNNILEECRELYEIFVSKGWIIKYWGLDYKPKSLIEPISTPFGQAHIQIGKFVIDLFTAWVDESGNYNTCQWGNLAIHQGFKKVKIEDETFNIPVNYNDILTKLYGDYKTPSDDHPSKFLSRKAYLDPINRTVTSIVLKKFHCVKQNKQFLPKQHYVSSMNRVEEILSKDKYLKIIKIE